MALPIGEDVDPGAHLVHLKLAIEGCDVYQYHELKSRHIRLFQLLPPHADEIVRDAFAQPVEVEDEILVSEYAALSYTWDKGHRFEESKSMTGVLRFARIYGTS
jgi:hypothetical protein